MFSTFFDLSECLERSRSLEPCSKLIEAIQYDNCNRQIRSEDALGNHREFAYDALGRQISTTEYLTGAVACVTSQTYDGVGNILGHANRKMIRFINRETRNSIW